MYTFLDDLLHRFAEICSPKDANPPSFIDVQSQSALGLNFTGRIHGPNTTAHASRFSISMTDAIRGLGFSATETIHGNASLKIYAAAPFLSSSKLSILNMNSASAATLVPASNLILADPHRVDADLIHRRGLHSAIEVARMNDDWRLSRVDLGFRRSATLNLHASYDITQSVVSCQAVLQSQSQQIPSAAIAVAVDIASRSRSESHSPPQEQSLTVTRADVAVVIHRPSMLMDLGLVISDSFSTVAVHYRRTVRKDARAEIDYGGQVKLSASNSSWCYMLAGVRAIYPIDGSRLSMNIDNHSFVKTEYEAKVTPWLTCLVSSSLHLARISNPSSHRIGFGVSLAL